MFWFFVGGSTYRKPHTWCWQFPTSKSNHGVGGRWFWFWFSVGGSTYRKPQPHTFLVFVGGLWFWFFHPPPRRSETTYMTPYCSTLRHTTLHRNAMHRIASPHITKVLSKVNPPNRGLSPRAPLPEAAEGGGVGVWQEYTQGGIRLLG